MLPYNETEFNTGVDAAGALRLHPPVREVSMRRSARILHLRLLLPANLCLALLALPAWAGSNGSMVRPEPGPHPRERMSADELVRLCPRAACFRIIRGKEAGRDVSMRLAPPEHFQEAWQLSFEGICRLYLRKTPQGAVRVGSMEMVKDGRRIRFTPSFPLVPHVLVPGRQIQTSGKAVIEDMDTGEQTNSGSYQQIVKALSRAVFETPAGPRKGYLLEHEFHLALDYSNLRIHLETGWSRSRKLVYWRTRTTIEKLGLFSTTAFRALAITGKGGGCPREPCR
jgi:hypothetical protein